MRAAFELLQLHRIEAVYFVFTSWTAIHTVCFPKIALGNVFRHCFVLHLLAGILIDFSLFISTIWPARVRNTRPKGEQQLWNFCRISRLKMSRHPKKLRSSKPYTLKTKPHAACKKDETTRTPFKNWSCRKIPTSSFCPPVRSEKGILFQPNVLVSLRSAVTIFYYFY